MSPRSSQLRRIEPLDPAVSTVSETSPECGEPAMDGLSWRERHTDGAAKGSVMSGHPAYAGLGPPRPGLEPGVSVEECRSGCRSGHWIPLVRALVIRRGRDAVARRRTAAAVGRARGRRRGIGRGRRLFPRPSLRAPSSPRRSRCWRRSARAPAGSRSAPPSSTCATRTRSTWPRTPARPTSSRGGGLQLGISRGSPEQVIDGWRYFGYQPAEGRTTPTWPASMRRCSSICCAARASPQPNPRPMFPNPPGLLRLEPHSAGCASASGGAPAPATADLGGASRA
jgi:hypothetical protein